MDSPARNTRNKSGRANSESNKDNMAAAASNDNISKVKSLQLVEDMDEQLMPQPHPYKKAGTAKKQQKQQVVVENMEQIGQEMQGQMSQGQLNSHDNHVDRGDQNQTIEDSFSIDPSAKEMDAGMVFKMFWS